MSFGARCGFFVLLTMLAPSALSEDRPAGPWQDPPVRDAGNPDMGKAAKPETSKDTAAPGARTGEASAQPPVERSAAVTRKRKARVAARDRRFSARRDATQAEYKTMRSKPRALRLSRHVTSWHDADAASPFVPDSDEYGEAPPRYPLTRLRREGWGNLLSGRRARRMHRMETRDDIVLNSRTIAFPGHRHGSEALGFEDDGFPE